MYRYPTNLTIDLTEDVQRVGELGPQALLALPESAPKTTSLLNMNGDDYAGDATTTGALPTDESDVMGTVNFEFDSDWFAIDVLAAAPYVITLTSNDIIADTLELILRDNTGEIISYGSNLYGIENTLTFIASATSTFFIEVIDNFGNQTGNYQLSAINPADDYSGDVTTTGVLTTDATATTGIIDYQGDSDWFGINTVAGKEYLVTLKTDDFTVIDLDLILRDSTGAFITYGEYGIDNTLLFTAAETGTLFVETDHVFLGMTGEYQLTAISLTDDYTGNTSTTGVLPVSQDLDGLINFHEDADWFSFTAVAGRSYRFSLNGDSLNDPSLGLHDSSGNLIHENDNAIGLNSEILHTFDEGGTYYLNASSAVVEDVGGYTLRATQTIDDFLSNGGTRGVISEGIPAYGLINRSGDTDWFAVNLFEGETYTFVRSSPHVDIVIRNFERDYVSDLGGGAELTFTPAADDVYYLEVIGQRPESLGLSYTITMATNPSDDYAGDATTTGVLPIDETVVTGSIETDGDVDWFAVTIDAGDILTLFSNAYAGLTYVQIVDAQGNALSSSMPSLIPSSPVEPIFFQADASGTYYVSVEASQYTPTPTYDLSARVTTPQQDDYAGDTSTQGVLLTDGSPVTGTIQTFGDVDYFAVTVGAGETWQFTVDGEADSPFDKYLRVMSSDDAELRSTAFVPSTNDTRLYYSFGEAGTYYISVSSQSGDAIGDYNLSGMNIVDDYGDNASSAEPLTIGSSVSGVLDWEDLVYQQEDYDWFAFDYQVGDAIKFSSTEFDSFYLIDKNFNIFDYSFITPGPDNGVIAAGLPAGKYYIAIEGSLGGTYTINSEYLVDDFDAGVTTSGVATINRPSDSTPVETTGAYDFESDVDWFAVSVLAGETLEILSEEDLELVDSNGVVIAVDQSAGGGFNSLVHSFAQAGQYFITVQTEWYDSNPVRDYAFTVTSNINILDINGTEAGETLNGTAGNDTINALGGSDIVYGAAGDDVINGGDGNDFLRGDAGDDTLDGGFGVDWLRGGAGADVLNGWAGTDWADYITSSAAVTVNLLTNIATGGDAEGDTFLYIERVYGSSHDDHIIGDNGVNYLRGWSGDDQLFGGAGNDYLQGGLGADALDGGAGSDWAYYISSAAGLTIDLQSPSNNTGEAVGDSYTSIENVVGSNHNDIIFGDSQNNFLRGASGDDSLSGGTGDDFLRGDLGADALFGDGGNDWAYYAASNAGITINLSNAGAASGGHAAGDTFNSIERAFGSRYADSITGDGAANYLRGYFGDDTLIGSGGNDFLQGDSGADVLDGGAGSDWAYYASSTATSGLTINLGDASQNTGEAAGDSYTSIENIVGSRFNDIIAGDSGDNYLRGFLGDDVINGGAGDDILRGEAGADIFVFEVGTGADVVIDFVDADDFLDFADFGAANVMNNAVQVGSDVVFTFGSDVITIEDITLTEVADNLI